MRAPACVLRCAVSAQDKRIVDALERGINTTLEVARPKLIEVVGDPAEFAWDLIEGPISEAALAGILAVLDTLGIETGRVKVIASPGARVTYEVLPPRPKVEA